MKYSFGTDKGKKRLLNQDACFAGYPDDNSCFAVVCDGMGGANAGEVAADIAVSTIAGRVMAGWRSDISAQSVENLLMSAISAANICVFDEAQTDEAKSGMGTTVVAAAVIPGYCVIAHAGDSRAYLIDSSIKRLTHDHSYVQTLVDKGLITEAEAREHPKKNYITRALGTAERIEIDFTAFEVSAGDKILLCSDGLTNYVSEDNIFDIVSQEAFENISDRLIALANKNGGGDNVTAAVIAV